MTGETLAEIRFAGEDPSGELASWALTEVAEVAVALLTSPEDALVPSEEGDWPWLCGDSAESSEERSDRQDGLRARLWRRELAGDLELARWFLTTLPPGMEAVAQSAVDVQRRPFPLEVDDGPYRCASCGESTVGRHARIVDRAQLFRTEISESDFRYCSDCLSWAAATTRAFPTTADRRDA